MLTKEYLSTVFEYRNGELFWKIKTKRPQQQIGGRAGTKIKGGRRYVSLDCVRHGEHRIIYFMHFGYTNLIIDHKDGNHLNNKIENLRAATKAQNEQNTTKRKTNTSGFKGVSFIKRRNKYRATITVHGKQRGLGHFLTPEQAFEAYKKAAFELHGEFANVA